MLTGNQPSYIKFDKSNIEQLEFLSNNVRNFYTRAIASWQYQDSGLQTGLFFAQIQNSYVACQGMIPIFLNIKGKLTSTAKSESSFLLSEFRGNGIFEELYFHAIETAEKDGVEIIWGFTALSNVWRNKLKFDVYDGLIHDSELQIQFSSDIQSTWKRQQSLASKLKQSIKALFSLMRGKRLPKKELDFQAKLIELEDVTQLNLFLSLYNEWGVNHPNFTFIQVNREYLKWRITSNPMIKYKVIGIYNQLNLIGCGIVNDSDTKAYLVDFVVPQKDNLNHCFIELIRFLKHTKCTSHLIYWGSHENSYTNAIHSLFSDYGSYRYVNTSMNFVIKKTSIETSKNIDISDYCINGLWTEGFRI